MIYDGPILYLYVLIISMGLMGMCLFVMFLVEIKDISKIKRELIPNLKSDQIISSILLGIVAILLIGFSIMSLMLLSQII